MDQKDRHFLEEAIAIALQAHEGQADKAGQPYILHPLRVMLAMDTAEEMIVAILHDVVEDSDVDVLHLAADGFELEICEAIEAISRRSREDYAEYIKRVKTNPIATEVKLADLADNLRPSRRASITTAQAQRYLMARETLRSKD